MNRIPQNDPGFLAFQRKLKSQNRRKRLKRLAIILATVLLLLSLLAGGIFWIWHAGDDPVASIPNTPPSQSESEKIPTEGPASPVVPDVPSSPETPDDPPVIPDDPNIEKTVVYVDVGHGFGNSGNVPDKGAGDGTAYYKLTGKYESDLNLDVALKLKQVLLDAGFEVIMGREGESTEYITVNDRVNTVNHSNADIFVSIHANSNDDTSVKGARVYYSSLNNAATKCENYAKAMAAALNATEGASLKTVGVHTDRSDVAVIKGIQIPTILIETCFMTSPEDAALAATEEWQEKMAIGICRGIQNYLAQVSSET